MLTWPESFRLRQNKPNPGLRIAPCQVATRQAPKIQINRNQDGGPHMFAAIPSILIVVWLLKSAINAKKNPWPLTGTSTLLFYITMQLWSTLVLKPIMDKSFGGHSIREGPDHRDFLDRRRNRCIGLGSSQVPSPVTNDRRHPAHRATALTAIGIGLPGRYSAAKLDGCSRATFSFQR